MPQQPLEAAPDAAGPAGPVGGEPGEGVAGERGLAELVVLARVRVVGRLQQGDGAGVGEAGGEQAGPGADAGAGVGGGQVRAGADGQHRLALDQDGAVRQRSGAGRQQQRGGVEGQHGKRPGQLGASSFSSGRAVPPSMAMEEMCEATRSSTGSFAGSSWTTRCS